MKSQEKSTFVQVCDTVAAMFYCLTGILVIFLVMYMLFPDNPNIQWIYQKLGGR